MSDEQGIPDEGPSGTQRRLRSPDRVVALSDGVFAIIITILVLEIAVPENLSERSLLEALDDLWPTFVAWVISFLVTGSTPVPGRVARTGAGRPRADTSGLVFEVGRHDYRRFLAGDLPSSRLNTPSVIVRPNHAAVSRTV